MPLYEYVCKTCTHGFEELVFGSDQPSCPKCQGGEVERVLSVPAPGKVKEGAGPAPAGAPCGSCPGAGGGCGFN
jgi:putative FmdB family regulatory protein